MNNANFGQNGYGQQQQAQQGQQQQGQQQQAQQGQQAQSQSNPAQPYYAPNPAILNPTLSGFNTDPNAMIQQIMAAFAPQQKNAQQGFMDTMALSGLSGAPVAAGENQLQQALAAGLAPSLEGAIQFSQGQGLQQSLANAGFSNSANSQNVSDFMNNNQFNVGQGNNALQQLLGQFGNINSGGMGIQGGIAQGAQNNFGIQGGDTGIGQLLAMLQAQQNGGGGGAFGGAYTPQGGLPTSYPGQYGYGNI
jgi:hypothetical protein